MLCYLYEAPKYLFFAQDLPDLLYYSHIPSAIVALLIGFIVFFKSPKALLNRLLLLISLTFTSWVALSLLVWAGNNATLFAFIWPFFGILAALLSVFCIYFTYVFVRKQDVSASIKGIFLLMLLPVLLFSHTDIGVSGFNISYCDAFMFEGMLIKNYYNALGFIAMSWILVILIRAYRKAESEMKTQILLMGIGIEFFLLSFISVIYIVTQLTALGYFENSSLEFYALFGMTFFMMMMGVLIDRFNTFNIAAHASQGLVISLLVLVGSQFTFTTTVTSTILTSVTLLLTTIAGLIIVRSVKREIRQREEIEQLAVKLKKANVRLKELDQMKSEFVSIASHQLRSPLTSIRGYASMLLEGSYGKLSEKANSAVERISESSTYMASSIEDYLNVSRIEAGNMKYELTDFNLRDEAEHVADDKRQEAMKKGLLVTFKSDMDKHGIVNADIGKTRQILHNLINNSIKYTPRGTITIFAHDDKKKKKMYVDIIDSGIGMKADELDDIFGKFERAHNANETNVTGTGLGLFVARKMAREMKGEVTAHSDGVGHGSTFRLELPLHM